MATYSILSLGSRRDVKQFRKGAAEKLGLSEGAVVTGAKPSLAAIKALFGRSDDVLFLAGHYVSSLYNEDSTIDLAFANDKLTITYDGQVTQLARGTGLKQTGPKLVIWGGCSVCSKDATIATMRALFGPHVMIGWIGQTGWEITDIMFGGKGHGNTGTEPLPTFATPNFFDALGGSITDATKLWKAWLQVANGIAWGNAPNDGGPYIDRFCAVDTGGTKHLPADSGSGV
ncbi:hypothetical protein [Bradyrhizobium sp. CCGB01]|uniref:hypothetical protein n=1 Tax=Bradyrhizobium sp. CCGB01 TaxID=2949634 RepID=UPI0020B422F8|nr:hypothetical protein [Bradyrhizobium sp. CCGB01]MCP3404471.1 hypothetical protein [Bradyrhizobium sp. CCGB01]